MEGEVRSISFNFIKGNLPRKPLFTSDVIKLRAAITGDSKYVMALPIILSENVNKLITTFIFLFQDKVYI